MVFLVFLFYRTRNDCNKLIGYSFVYTMSLRGCVKDRFGISLVSEDRIVI